MTPSDYISLLCERLLNFQRDGTLCDVMIKARNGTVLAHSAVLAASNPHLRRTLEEQSKVTLSYNGERFVYRFDVNNCSVAAIISVLQSVYSGQECSTHDPECQTTLMAMGFFCALGSSDTPKTQVKSSGQLSKSLLELQHDGILCDVTINAVNGSLYAHSAILAAANPVLLTLFEKQARDNRNKSRRLQYFVDLHDFSLDSIVASLQSVYIGMVSALRTPEDVERYLKLNALGLGIQDVTDTTWDQSSVLVTSSDEVMVGSTLNQRREEIYGVVDHRKLNELNSQQCVVRKTEGSGDDKVVSDDADNGEQRTSLETFSYMLHDAGQGTHDYMSSEMYIGCETEETVEIQEEEVQSVPCANPVVQDSRAELESILIIPATPARNRRDNVTEQFGFSMLSSSNQRAQPVVSKRGRAPAVTVIDFQRVKATESLSRASRVDRSYLLGAAERSAVVPPKRYVIAGKANHSIVQQPSQLSKSSSILNNVSILLPPRQQRAPSADDSGKMSILKMPVNVNDGTANNHTKSTSRQLQNERFVNLGEQFQQSGNVKVENAIPDRKSLLLPVGSYIKNVDHIFESESITNVAVKKQQSDALHTRLRISTKIKTDVRQHPGALNLEGNVERVKSVKEGFSDRDGINESERESNNESDNRRTCRKRKTTVPVKKVMAVSTSRCDGEVECDFVSTNSATNDPPCEEVEVTTSTEIRQTSCSALSVPLNELHDAGSMPVLSSSCEDNVHHEDRSVVDDMLVTDSSKISTVLLNNGDQIEEFMYVIEPDCTDEVKPEISLSEERLSEGGLSIQNISGDVVSVDGVLYTITEAIQQVENESQFCYDGLQEDHRDIQTVEAIAEDLNSKRTVLTCKYCEKVFVFPEELSEHMALNHKCAECDHEFKQTSNLRKHVRIHHNRERSHECPICLKGFPFRSALKDHIRVHDEPQDDQATFSCGQCEKVFSRVSGLRRHQKVDHSDVLAYECPHCDKRYAYQCNLNNHMATHSALKPFTCETCGLGFKQNSNLLKHMRTQHNKCIKCANSELCTCVVHSGFACATCGKMCGGRAQLKVHQRVHSGEKPEVCDLCGTAFQHKSNLMKHRIKHGGTKPYVCTYCKRGFFSNHSLQSHMRLHTGESPYQCDVCGKRFCTRNGLQVHSVLHGNQREFVCGTCGKAFAQLGNLNKHLAIHTGARPFPCAKCEMAFVDSSALRRHEVLHTRERNFACPTCGRTFMYLTSLRAHKLTHEEAKQHVCKICGKAFRQKAGYARHLKIHDNSMDCGEDVVLKPGEYIVYLTE